MVSAVLAGRYIFLGLGLVTASTVLYTCITDGTPFRSELLTPWMNATLIDFYVNVVLITVDLVLISKRQHARHGLIKGMVVVPTIGIVIVESKDSWVWYKESSWTSCLIWTVLLFCFGSVTACWYVAFEFFKMSPDDPVHLVLLKDRTSRQLEPTESTYVHEFNKLKQSIE